MDATAFAYWLNGFVELHGQPPTPEQWEVIKEHLGLVFNKVTTKVAYPPYTPNLPVVEGGKLCGSEKAQGTYCAGNEGVDNSPRGYRLLFPAIGNDLPVNFNATTHTC